MELLLFILGFPLLLISANYFIDACSSLASRMGVSEFILGLTLVSLGTSLPELTVSVISSLEDRSDLVFGNIIGSNLANLLLILGSVAIFNPISMPALSLKRDLPFSIVLLFTLGFLVNDSILYNRPYNILSRFDAGVLLICVAFFLFILISSRDKSVKIQTKEFTGLKYPLPILIISLIGVILSGKWVVEGAVYISSLFGLSQSVISLTIIAVGTSLPELITSVTAALKSKTELAVGNVIGSNIVNIALILGLSGVIRPISYNLEYNSSLLVLLLASVFLFALIWRSDGKISKFGGWILLCIYIISISTSLFL